MQREHAKRKKNQIKNIAQNKKKKTKKICSFFFFLFLLPLLFLYFFVMFFGFWSTKNCCIPKKASVFQKKFLNPKLKNDIFLRGRRGQETKSCIILIFEKRRIFLIFFIFSDFWIFPYLLREFLNFCKMFVHCGILLFCIFSTGHSLQGAHLRVPAFKHHQNSTRRPPRERKRKERNFVRSGERDVPREGGPHNPNHAHTNPRKSGPHTQQ